MSNTAAIAAAAVTQNQHSMNVSGLSQNNNSVVGLHYKIGKKIGEGSFGVLFEGSNIINGVAVAIKFEPRKTEAPQLRDEYRTYKHLQGCDGIPNAYYFGQEGLHSILVIDLLGPSLEDLFDWCGRRFSVKTVVQIAVQMLNLIEEVHRHDLIYRDIKPDNFLIGRQGFPTENKVHLIDFGMAKQYRDPRTKQHIPYREKKSLSGTARYMSINTHLGREQLRRDDLEALGHVFFYFLRGQLPWQGLKAPTNKQKYEKIGDKKRTTAATLLCEGFPKQFAEYLDSVRSLPFEAEPAYEEYRMLLLSALDDLGLSCDGDFDWMHLNGGKGWDSSINKKPNLHGYGHPNPPNERERRHRELRRNRPHQSTQGGNVIASSAGNNNLNSNINQSTQQQQQLSAAQSHQQKLQHLINRPLPPIKQELQPHSRLSSQGNNDMAGSQAVMRNAQPNYVNTQRADQYEQQQVVQEEKKGFWSKLCCQ
ncbi:kinase-like protein [Metschnikowia bicuspidata var. bicuspidata NRRL YB-4993]|uniref:non-specific serine/threonine protein kinase n=1 Tax=Metschnikowia bicuspidata var. bicuspidata NRRL YB-4993 TaxID=869754 RepID=A0A1A0HDI7_9ASCO|nr:kinase-like protein [Metschnikowia bicuspidata var. bicuspidata NRRL YB-4993]OBA22149.1 kinase-like protein [Metschnikowia bicuspidata var. bicuspidata NRRL YB-4993]